MLLVLCGMLAASFVDAWCMKRALWAHTAKQEVIGSRHLLFFRSRRWHVRRKRAALAAADDAAIAEAVQSAAAVPAARVGLVAADGQAGWLIATSAALGAVVVVNFGAQYALESSNVGIRVSYVHLDYEVGLSAETQEFCAVCDIGPTTRIRCRRE